LTLREGCLGKAASPRDMDYANRLTRLAENYEKKQRLELISHSLLQSASQTQSLDSQFLSPSHSGEELKSQSSRSRESNCEKWKQEMKEKKMRAELKGFQSVQRNLR
jgi:hypothetical protein